ncbi:helix-turn-helix domain-containing protein [Dechloromonas sp. ZY10]|uniref:AraC family transcriptional regulator n=1 Tax=Dechloromonas aquae TaxID=2664436 RepID=UPI003527C936
MSDLIVPPPPGLADCVQHALLKTLPGGPYLLPAGLQPLFLLILRGRITLHHAGRDTVLAPFLLCGGTRGIRRASAEPGTRILTLSLQPGRLRQLLPLPPLAVMEEAVPLSDLLAGEARGEALRLAELAAGAAASSTCEVAAGEVAVGQARAGEAALLAALFACLQGWRMRQAAAPDLVLPLPAWDAPASELAAGLGLGLRQFERRFLQSYGQPLKSYRRQARCSLLLARFMARSAAADAANATDSPAWSGLADLAALGGYYDQAHLHRDLLSFTGYSPSALLAGVASDDPAFWPYRLAREQLQRLFGPGGY